MRHFSTLNMVLLSLLAGGMHTAAAGEASPQETPVKLKMSGDFNFSGFTNVTLNAPAGDKITLSIDDLGFFASGHINKALNPFIEVELAGVNLLQQGGDPLSAGYPHILLERLFNDSSLTNSLSLRLGKMLSPVGEWNLIHVPPLVATTTRPMTSYYGFSEFTTGASLIYADNKGVLPDMQLYVQPGNEFRPRPLDIVVREYDHIAGFHLNRSFGLNDKLGFSFQHAHIKDTDEQQNLTGFNASKEFGPLALETETIHTHLSGANDRNPRVRDTEWGTYVQGTYTLNERWSLTGRYEHYLDRNSDTVSKNALFGTAYKSSVLSSSLWKLEYIQQSGPQLDNQIQTGLFASMSNFF